MLMLNGIKNILLLLLQEKKVLLIGLVSLLKVELGLFIQLIEKELISEL